MTNVSKQEVTTGEKIGSGDPGPRLGAPLSTAMEIKVWSIPIPSIMQTPFHCTVGDKGVIGDLSSESISAHF